ncbi:MAG: hypothetical protein WC373_09645 [Smithella sp.]
MSKKRLILLFFADEFGIDAEIDPIGKGGIQFESRTINGDSAAWEYRLITTNEDIDFENCCLKAKVSAPTLPPAWPVLPDLRPGEMLKTDVRIVEEKSGQMALV